MTLVSEEVISTPSPLSSSAISLTMVLPLLTTSVLSCSNSMLMLISTETSTVATDPTAPPPEVSKPASANAASTAA